MWFRAREVLLKPEYRDWYPWIIPGVGYRASWLVSIVRRQRRDAEPHWEPEPREHPPDSRKVDAARLAELPRPALTIG